MSNDVSELLKEYEQLFNLPKTLLSGRLPSKPSTLKRKYLKATSDKQEFLQVSQYKVVAGMSTIRSRRNMLRRAVESLAPQVDELHIYHNYAEDKTLSSLSWPDNVFHHQMPDGDIEDIGKYYFLVNELGSCDYFFSVDDDIEYPANYVRKTIHYLQRFGNKAVVSWHGSIIKEGFQDYYSAESRHVLTFGSQQMIPRRLDIVGSGAAAWSSSLITVEKEIFKTKNMADIHFSKLLASLDVPAFLVPHTKGEMVDLSHMDTSPSIYHGAISGGNKGRNHYRNRVNELVASSQWPTSRFKNKVMLVARTPESSKKGGVLAAGLHLKRTLEQLDSRIETVDPQKLTEKFENLKSQNFDFGVVYTGDGNSRDKEAYELVIRQPFKFPLLVNPSFDGSRKRTKEIVDDARDATSDITHMVFSPDARASLESRGLRSRLVLKPGLTYSSINVGGNTVNPSERPVLLGDLGKFLDERITPKNREIFERFSRLFGVQRLAFLNQYEPKFIPEWLRKDDVIIYPFQKSLGVIADKILMAVHVHSNATFEMVPYELASFGTPILGRSMSQSLNFYLGPKYMFAKDDFELLEVCKQLQTLSQAAHDKAVSKKTKISFDPIFAHSLMSAVGREG